MARLFALILVVAALPTCADNLRDLEQARNSAFENWGRVKAKNESLQGQLETKRKQLNVQSAKVRRLQKEDEESSFAWRAIYGGRLKAARQEQRTLSDEIAKKSKELKQGKTVEQARRLRLISALRAYTDRLFEVAERALALKPPRKGQANQMVQKALKDLPLLENLEKSKWVKPEIPALESFEQEAKGRSLTYLDRLAGFYQELADEAQRGERNLLPEHTRLSKRLERLDQLRKRGIAANRLPVLIERTREALGRADDVISAFRIGAKRYGDRAKRLKREIELQGRDSPAPPPPKEGD